jgi:hypothetical protein
MVILKFNITKIKLLCKHKEQYEDDWAVNIRFRWRNNTKRCSLVFIYFFSVINSIFCSVVIKCLNLCILSGSSYNFFEYGEKYLNDGIDFTSDRAFLCQNS